MNKKVIYIAAGILGILALFFIFLSIQKPATTQTGTNATGTNTTGVNTGNLTDTSGNTNPTGNAQVSPSTTATQQLSPDEVAAKFYTWYLAYPTNAYSSGAYKTSPYLTPKFIGVISTFTPYDGIHDPIFCTSNKKSNFIVNQGTPAPQGKINVYLQENLPNGQNLYRVVLKNIAGAWLIDDIICQN
jgi:hypothetical protein